MFQWPHKYGKQSNNSAPAQKFLSAAYQSQRETAVVGLTEKFTAAECAHYKHPMWTPS